MIKKYQKAFTLTEISIVILVIGILIAGISQAIEMFSEASLKSARNLSKSSRITRIDDLSLWLDATSDKAFDKEKDDNSTISIWKDTNPRSTSQIVGNPVSSSLPTYTLSSINGLPTASFKKTSSNCMTISNQSFINNSEDFTLYLIYSPKTLDDGIIIEKNNATATTFPFSLELNSGFYKFNVKDSTKILSVYSSKQAKINTPNLIRLSRSKGSQIEIVINGVSSTQSDTLTSSTLNTAELAIGCRNGATPANFINGDIGETSFFNRNLTTKEKTDIEEYLYKKWKMKKYEGALATPELTCSVPSDKNLDPTMTSVMATVSPQIINCKTGYSGTPKYTCINGVFTIDSGSCTQITYCIVSDCASENFTGTIAIPQSEIPCFNLKSLIGSTVNFGTTGERNFTKYPPSSTPQPTYTVRWRCNNNGTMDIDLEKECTYRLHYGDTYWPPKSSMYMGTYYKYCCGVMRDNNPCPWSY